MDAFTVPPRGRRKRRAASSLRTTYCQRISGVKLAWPPRRAAPGTRVSLSAAPPSSHAQRIRSRAHSAERGSNTLASTRPKATGSPRAGFQKWISTDPHLAKRSSPGRAAPDPGSARLRSSGRHGTSPSERLLKQPSSKSHRPLLDYLHPGVHCVQTSESTAWCMRRRSTSAPTDRPRPRTQVSFDALLPWKLKNTP